MVGDSVPRDIKGATAAGMKKALVCANAQAPARARIGPAHGRRTGGAPPMSFAAA